MKEIQIREVGDTELITITVNDIYINNKPGFEVLNHLLSSKEYEVVDGNNYYVCSSEPNDILRTDSDKSEPIFLSNNLIIDIKYNIPQETLNYLLSIGRELTVTDKFVLGFFFSLGREINNEQVLIILKNKCLNFGGENPGYYNYVLEQLLK